MFAGFMVWVLGEPLHWRRFAAFGCIMAGVAFPSSGVDRAGNNLLTILDDLGASNANRQRNGRCEKEISQSNEDGRVSVLCKLRGHLPDRGTARHDGQDYWTNCKRCNAPLIRAPDGWREPTATEIQAHEGHQAERGQLDDDAGVVRGRSDI